MLRCGRILMMENYLVGCRGLLSLLSSTSLVHTYRTGQAGGLQKVKGNESAAEPASPERNLTRLNAESYMYSGKKKLKAQF